MSSRSGDEETPWMALRSRSARLAARVGSLTAVVAATAVAGASTAPAASLHSAYDFNWPEPEAALSPSFAPALAWLSPIGDPTFPEVDIDEGVANVPRRVADFAAGEGFSAATVGVGQWWETMTGSYTIALLFKLDTVTDRRRILDFSNGASESGVYVDDGKVTLVQPGGTVAQQGTAVLAPDTWTHLVISTTDGIPRVYVNPTPDAFSPDVSGTSSSLVPPESRLDARLGTAVTLFEDDGTEESGGALARFRVFKGAMSDAQVASLDPFDATAPTGSVSPPPAQGGVAVAGPNTMWFGEFTDDGTAPVDVAWRVAEAVGDADVVPWTPVEGWPGYGAAAESLVTQWSVVDGIGPGLVHGRSYVLEASARDAATNTSSTVTMPFVADTVPPAAPVITEPGATTAHGRPTLSGTADVGAAHRSSVEVYVCRGADACDFASDTDVIAGHTFPVQADGRWSGYLGATTTGMTDTSIGLGLGPYRIEAVHCDLPGNCASGQRDFTVVSSRTGVVRPPAPPPPPAPTPPAPVAAQPITITPLEWTQRTLASGVTLLRAERARGLLKDGVSLPCVPLGAGTCVWQLWRGAAPKRVSVNVRTTGPRRVAALLGHGRRDLVKPGAAKARLVLTAAGRGRLRGAASTKVTARAIYVPKGGKPIAVDRTFALRR